MRTVLIGPPGTGKTTEIVDWTRRALSQGHSPNSVVLVAFARASAQELKDRVGDSRLEYVRTIHSLCHRLIGGYKPMAWHHWKTFAEAHKYSLSNDALGEDDDEEEVKAHDPLRSAHQLAMSKRINIEEACQFFPQADVASAALFTQRLNEFKHSAGVIEHDDAIIEVLRRKLVVVSSLLVVDEAQDLSPLQAEAVNLWAERSQCAVLVGDDDQAVYDFAGADGQLMRSWIDGGAQKLELQQSYRLPRAVHALAQKTASAISNRIERAFHPRDEEGLSSLLSSDRLTKRLHEKPGLVLGRTKKMLRRVARDLADTGIPFRSRIPRLSPLDVAAAANTVIALLENRPVTKFDLIEVRRVLGDRATEATGTFDGIETAGMNDLPSAIREKIRKKGLSALGKHGPALQKLRSRFGKIPEAEIELSTIHGAKGREREIVYVLNDWAKRPAQSLRGNQAAKDSEHRVAYVAVTRARNEIVVVTTQADNIYPFFVG